MLVPVRCFSCNKIVGGAYEEFVERKENGEDPAKVMDDLGIKRYCCRKIYVSHLDLIDEFLHLIRLVFYHTLELVTKVPWGSLASLYLGVV